MKRFFALIFCLLFCLNFVACSPSGEKNDNGNSTDNNQNQTGDSNTGDKVDFSTYGSYWFSQHDYKVMPITTYNSCPPKEGAYAKNFLTDENTFKLYKEANINVVMGLTDFVGQHQKDVYTALEYCYDYNLAYLLAYRSAINVKSEASVRNDLARVINHENFAGIMLSDEPGRKMFDDLVSSRQIFENVLKDTSSKLYHVNLFPNYANQKQLYFRTYSSTDVIPNGEYTYEQYLADYMEIFKPQVLSYDFYPIIEQFPTLSNGYFENMSIIRKTALKANIPFWTYIQTCSYTNGQRLPTQIDLFWNVNTCLAYGSKGIQYFCGVLPNDTNEVFNGALFDRNGNTTEIYNFVKNVNKQITAVDEYLMCSKSCGLIQTGFSPLDRNGDRMDIPQDDRLTQFNEVVEIKGEHILTGCFDYKGKTALYVVNNAISTDSDIKSVEDTATINFSKTVSGFTLNNAVKNTFNGTTLNIPLTAGQGVLVVLD